ncbi:DNA repair protein RecN [Thermovibrio sp.]
MITELRLFNFGGISGELLFSSGLNVVIGETGAGKSLLLSSVNFLKGERFPFVCEGTFVEAVFQVKGEEITVRREVRSSRSRFFLNGMRVPQKRVEEVISPLVLFQSQRLSAKLLKPSYQLAVLDEVSGVKELISSYKELYRRYKELSLELKSLRKELTEREREVDVLKFQIKEIEEANLKEGEEEELLELKERVSRANELKELRERSLSLLYYGEPSALSLISSALREFEKLSLFEGIRERLEEVYYLLEGVVSEIESKVEPPSTEFSLEEIEDRLYQIERVKRKYGPTLKEVEDFLKKAKERLSLLENGEELLKEKEESLKELKRELLTLGKEISKRRREGAKKLEELLTSEFRELGLEKSVFKVEITELPEPGPLGLDEVNFLFSGNPSLPLSPLKESASGGELSRMLLSILKVLSPRDSVMVFDEIDTGISGKILKRVAEKLKEIGQKSQVVAVSHWPQVAALADRVFKVEKESSGEVKVKELNPNELKKELAVMISGSLTEGSLKAAEDLLRLREETWNTQDKRNW